LPKVDLIVVLSEGTISAMGSYQELLQEGGAFADFLKMYLDEAQTDEIELDEESKLRAELQLA
jgi:hypothetical protein